MGTHYRINSPHVVAETLDGEATIVDLDSGTYYALNESGSFIWDALVAGTAQEDVIGTFASTYAIESAEARRATEELIGQLTDQRLVVASDGSAENGGASQVDGEADSNGRRPFREPELSTYTDMQELLLLDPIHEVDDSGWPSQA